MAPKKIQSPGSGGKQQTLAASFANSKSNREKQNKLNDGRIHISQQPLQHRVLEEKFMTTATTCCEHYKRGSWVAPSNGTSGGSSDRHTATMARTSQRRKLNSGAEMAIEDATDQQLDQDEDDEGLSKFGKSSHWEEQAHHMASVLVSDMVSDAVVTASIRRPRKHQELLMHMVLNADHHILGPNLSTRALELLLVNARLHPVAKQHSKEPHILLVNGELWKPDGTFSHEADCYTAVCKAANTTRPQLSFLLAVLQGARRHVQQQLAAAGQLLSQEEQQHAAAGPGPWGCCLALKYIVHIMVEDLNARRKVYLECGHRTHEVKGDLAAGKIMSTSVMAGLLSAMGNIATGDWASVLSKVVDILVELILSTAPQGGPEAGATPPPRHTNQAGGTLTQVPCAAAVAMAVSAGEVGAVARQLLCCLYDLFMVLEEEKQMPSKDVKDTDCRMLALALYKLLAKKGSNLELASKIQDPRSKAVLLSVLSPKACLHLLGVTYAKDAAKRWQAQKGEMVIPKELQWLQPLRDYAEGNTTARLIWDHGPARVNPVEVLQDLDISDNFKQARQGSGQGFITWLSAFASAAALHVQQGTGGDVEPLKAAFDKVVVRMQQQQQEEGSTSDLDAGVQLHNKIALLKAQNLMNGLAQGPQCA